MTKIALALAAAVSVCVPNAVRAAVLFDFAGIESYSYAEFNGVPASDYELEEWDSTFPSQTTAAAVQFPSFLILAGPLGGIVLAEGAQATSTVSASFLNAAQGTFSFDGSATAAARLAGAGGTANKTGSTVYRFQTDELVNLNLGYSTFGGGSAFGNAGTSLGSFLVTISGLTPGSSAPGPVTILPNLSGTYEFDLAPGRYDLIIAESEARASASTGRGIFGAAVDAGATVSQGGTFDFMIRSPVPEPATWAMMTVGFGAIGAAMRQRRRRRLALG